jgi:hypothetical protein
MTQLNLAAHPCSECLTTRNRIVSGSRAAQIVRDCRATDKHFICHKSADGELVHCRGVHNINESLAYRVAKAFGIPIVEKEMG